jgi:hypothetical protein
MEWKYPNNPEYVKTVLKAQEDSENPSIGIILCAEKNDLIVELALRNSSKPIGVAEYQLAKELPLKIKENLPTIDELKTELIDKEMKEKR